jgi:heat shock protein HslJ
VTYADRAPGESFAVAPSVGKSVLLKFDPAAMQFGMVESDFSGEADSLIVKLDQKKWQWVKTSYTDGKVFVAKKAEAFTLTFTAGGTVSATTDCNGVSGTYTAGSGALTFGTLASTLMFCDGSEEGVFTEMLDQVASYAFTSKGELELGLQAGTGKMIFQ